MPVVENLRTIACMPIFTFIMPTIITVKKLIIYDKWKPIQSDFIVHICNTFVR